MKNTSNLKDNVKMSQEYEVNYYGEETFLPPTSVYENEKNIFESRISELEWKNKVLVIISSILLILSIGTLTISIIDQLNIVDHTVDLKQSSKQISEIQIVQNRIQVNCVLFPVEQSKAGTFKLKCQKKITQLDQKPPQGATF